MDRGSAGEDFSSSPRRRRGCSFSWASPRPGRRAGAAPNHSPRFQVDEAGLITGLRATLHVVADFTGSGVPA